ncbi:MAG: hypothetical protein K8R21_03830, partial [Leptospira sp.]|nr:hypothetical protein [Leptospira sp.]
FAAYNGILKGNIKGRLFKGDPEKPAPLGAFYPDMEIKLYIGSDKPQYMLKGISFSGAMDTQIKMNDFLVKGFIKFKDTNIISKSGTCPGDDCKIYFVNKLNLDFPFLHDLGARVTKELIEGDKTRFIRTYGQNHIPNFTIFQVVGPHPSIPGAPFEFVKNNGNTPGFSARMDYTENYFLLQNMKILILDGVIYGRDVLFNIGGGNSELMQYSATLQVKDIDLKQLLPAKSRHKIDDGKIKADMNLNGRNLSDPIGNLNLFFSVYQIGEDFGKSAMNVMSSQNIVMDYIYSSYNVEKMEIELSKGLVYASIFFKPSVLGAIVSIDDNKISQERMPLANFLKRARSEVSRYEK